MLVINPNPCFDRTLYLNNFSKGAIMRGDSAVITAGGKGINVARVIRAFQKRAILAVLVGVRDSDNFHALLSNEGAEFVSSSHDGIVRVATIIFDSEKDSTTIINEKGSRIEKAQWSKFVAKVAAQVQPNEIVSCMGSFPIGVDKDSITELVDVIKTAQGVIIFDSSPEFLDFAISAGVDIVSPNLDEAEALIYGKDSSHFTDDLTNAQARAEIAASELVKQGVTTAFVTAGSAGVAIATDGFVDFVHGVKINLVSAVGAGDSFVAGLMIKYEEQRAAGQKIDWKAIARFAVATASASCEQSLSGGIDTHRANEIFQEILNLEVAV